jgi:hypothetical protein
VWALAGPAAVAFLLACVASAPSSPGSVDGSPTQAPSTPIVSHPSDNWQAPILVAEGDYRDIALALDGAGNAHAAAALDGHVFYLTNASGSWSRERLSNPGPDGTDQRPALAVDDNGEMWLTFARTGCVDICPGPPDEDLVEGIYLMTREADSWRPPELLVECFCPDNSMAVHDGTLELAYVAGDPIDDVSRLRHLSLVDGQVIDERVARAGHQPSLALDERGLPQIMFVEGTDLAPDGLRYATRAADGSWSIGAGPSRAPADSDPILLAGVDGAPTAVWSRTGDGAGVFTATREGDAWSEPLSLIGAFRAASAALGAGSALRLTALGGAGVLLYGNYGDGPPTTTELAFPTTAASVALDGDGRPHILFVTGTDNGSVARQLYYVVGPPGGR